MPIWFILFTAT